MLQPPGASRDRAYASNRRKTPDVATPEESLRQLQRSAPNKKCADCGAKLPQCVNLTIGTFICISCAGIHRELNNRVKGIGHSTFTQEEVDKLKTTDNDKVNALWLARYNPNNDRMKPPQGNQNQQELRAWIRRKYQDKAWYGGSGDTGGGAPQGRGPPPQRGRGPPPQQRPGQPQPTMVQMPPAKQAPPQEDLLGFGGGPTPAAPPASGDGWDAFGGSNQQKQVPANDPFAQPPAPPAPQQTFANFGSPQPAQQQDPFAAPQQGQNNFASFPAPGAPPTQQPPQQQPPPQGQSQQFGNFANFGNQQPPQPPAPAQNMGQMGGMQPQQGQNNFASFPAPGGPPAQQQQPPQQPHGQPQQFGNFASFGNQQMQQPSTPGGVPPQQQNAQQPQQFGNFNQQPPHPPLPAQTPNMGQMGGMQAQQQPNAFPQGGQQQNVQPAPQMTGMQSGFGAFGQLQQQQQQPPPQIQQPGPPQGQQQNAQQPQQFGSFNQQPLQLPMPGQAPNMGPMGGMQAQQQPNAFPQGGQQQNVQPAPQMAGMQSGFGAFDQLQQQQQQPPPQMQMQQPQGGPSMQSTEIAAPPQVAPGPTNSSVMSAPKEDPMEAFAQLSVGNDGAAPTPATGSAEQSQPKANNNQDTTQTSRYAADQIVCYKSNGDRYKAKIAKVHLDDALEPFYTIKLQFGKEKQTDDTHLEELNPLYEQLESAILSLSSDQLAKVEQFVAQLPPSNANESKAPGVPTPAPTLSSIPTNQALGSFGIPSAPTSGGVPTSVLAPPSPGNMSHVSQLTQPPPVQSFQAPAAQPGAGMGFSNGGGGGLSTIPSPGSLKIGEHMSQGNNSNTMDNMPPPPLVPPLQSQTPQQVQPQPPQGQGMQQAYMGQGMPAQMQPQQNMMHAQGMPQQQMNQQMQQQQQQQQQQPHQQMMMNQQQQQQPQMSFPPPQGMMNSQQQQNPGMPAQAQMGQNPGMGQQQMQAQQNQPNQMGQMGQPPQQGMQQPNQQPTNQQPPMSPQGNPFDMY